MTGGRTLYVTIGSLCMGTGGYLLGRYGVNIPLYIDSSLTCMPFVCAGMLLRKNTTILTSDVNGHRISTLAVAAICLVAVWLLCRGTKLYYMNSYDCGIQALYLTGILGSIGVLLTCKVISRLPLISYIGRYSIVVLGIHHVIIEGLKSLMLNIHLSPLCLHAVILAIVLILSLASIYLLKKYVPFLIAQKDIIRFGIE